MTARYIYSAVRYVCFMDASACRQEMMDKFHFLTCCVPFGGVGTAPRGHSHLISWYTYGINRSNRVHDIFVRFKIVFGLVPD